MEDRLPSKRSGRDRSCKHGERLSQGAESEDPETRTMLAEIDLENPQGEIRDQMFQEKFGAQAKRYLDNLRRAALIEYKMSEDNK